MVIKDKALQYCRDKGLYTLNDKEILKKCDESFSDLRKLPDNYEEGKKLLLKMRGE